MKDLKLGDRVRYLGIKGHVRAVSTADRTCVVGYDLKPPRFSPWISWDLVEVIPQPAGAVEVPA